MLLAAATVAKNKKIKFNGQESILAAKDHLSVSILAEGLF